MMAALYLLQNLATCFSSLNVGYFNQQILRPIPRVSKHLGPIRSPHAPLIGGWQPNDQSVKVFFPRNAWCHCQAHGSGCKVSPFVPGRRRLANASLYRSVSIHLRFRDEYTVGISVRDLDGNKHDPFYPTTRRPSRLILSTSLSTNRIISRCIIDVPFSPHAQKRERETKE